MLVSGARSRPPPGWGSARSRVRAWPERQRARIERARQLEAPLRPCTRYVQRRVLLNIGYDRAGEPSNPATRSSRPSNRASPPDPGDDGDRHSGPPTPSPLVAHRHLEPCWLPLLRGGCMSTQVGGRPWHHGSIRVVRSSPWPAVVSASGWSGWPCAGRWSLGSLSRLLAVSRALEAPIPGAQLRAARGRPDGVWLQRALHLLPLVTFRCPGAITRA